MWLGVVGHLIADPRLEPEPSSVTELGFEVAGEAEQDVPLLALMVRPTAGRVLDHPDSDPAELARAPECDARLPTMLRGLDGFPVGGAEGDIGDLHAEMDVRGGVTAMMNTTSSVSWAHRESRWNNFTT